MNTRQSTSVDRLLVALLDESEETNTPVCELLSELVKACLLSDDDKAHHVYGLDFIKQCDACLARSLGDETKH